MGITVGIVNDAFPLDGVFRHIEVDEDLAGLLIWFSREDRKFERGEQLPGVTIAHRDEVGGGVGMQIDLFFSKSPFRIRDCSVQQFEKILFGERFKLENLTPRNEGTVDVEIGIVSRRSDESHGASFDMGEEDILLRFVESMNFINKEGRDLVAGSLELAGAFDGLADLGNVTLDAGKIDKPGFGSLRNQFGETGLPDSGRAVKDKRGESIGLNCTTEEFALSEDVFLTNVFAEVTGPHARSEGHRRIDLVRTGSGPCRRVRTILVGFIE